MTDIFKDKGLDEDPGWAQKAGDPLVALRFLFLAFWLGVVVLCGVAWKMHLDDKSEPNNVALSLAVIAAASFSSLSAPLLVRRELDGTSLRTLALSFRSRFMLRLAFAEVVMLVGFAASKVWGPWWVVFVGAAITVVGFIRLAPTARHLQQDQDRLSLSGCQLSLTEALRTPTAAPND